MSFGFLSYSLPLDPESGRAWRFAWDPIFFELVAATGGHVWFDLTTYRGLDPASRRLFLFVCKVFARRETTPRMNVRHLGERFPDVGLDHHAAPGTDRRTIVISSQSGASSSISTSRCATSGSSSRRASTYRGSSRTRSCHISACRRSCAWAAKHVRSRAGHPDWRAIDEEIPASSLRRPGPDRTGHKAGHRRGPIAVARMNADARSFRGQRDCHGARGASSSQERRPTTCDRQPA